MERDIVVDDLIRSSLRLTDDWRIDQLLFDEQTRRVDVYLSHSGGGLPTIYASQKRENLIDFTFFLFDLGLT